MDDGGKADAGRCRRDAAEGGRHQSRRAGDGFGGVVGMAGHLARAAGERIGAALTRFAVVLLDALDRLLEVCLSAPNVTGELVASCAELEGGGADYGGISHYHPTKKGDPLGAALQISDWRVGLHDVHAVLAGSAEDASLEGDRRAVPKNRLAGDLLRLLRALNGDGRRFHSTSARP